MYEIKALPVANRVALSRAGSRVRRLPSVVLGNGAVVKITPGRSIRVTEDVYESNRTLLNKYDSVIEIKDLRSRKEEVKPPAPVPPEPVEVEEVKVEEVKIEDVEEVKETLEVAPVEEEKPKAKRKRRAPARKRAPKKKAEAEDAKTLL